MIDFVAEIGTMEKIPLDKVVKGLSAEGYDLLEKLLELDYKKRITAADALKHPYLKDLHNPDDEVLQFLINKACKNTCLKYGIWVRNVRIYKWAIKRYF